MMTISLWKKSCELANQHREVEDAENISNHIRIAT